MTKHEQESAIILAIEHLAGGNPAKWIHCAEVVRLLLEQAGLTTPESEHYLAGNDTTDSPAASELYTQLVHLATGSPTQVALLEGQGNFGSAANQQPPAHSRYTRCRLTPAGQASVCQAPRAGYARNPRIDESQAH